MAIKLENQIELETVKAALKAGGATVSVMINSIRAPIKLFIKNVPKLYHRVSIDIDGTGFKISDKGREALKKLADFYGLPDVREPRRLFTNTYVLDIDVQRGSEDMSGELRILDQLFLLFEQDENLQKIKFNSYEKNFNENTSKTNFSS